MSERKHGLIDTKKFYKIRKYEQMFEYKRRGGESHGKEIYDTEAEKEGGMVWPK